MATATPMGMIDADDLARAMLRYGNVEPGQGGNGQRNPFQQMMMMAMLRNASDKNLAGYGLGKLLRQGFDSWKERYEARGDLKHMIQTKGRDAAQEWINKIAERDPKRGAYMQEHLDKWVPQTAQPTQEAAQPSQEATQPLLLGAENQEAVSQAFANAQMPQNIQGLLGQLTAPSQGVPAANEAFGDISTTSNIPLSTDFWERLKNTGLVR